MRLARRHDWRIDRARIGALALLALAGGGAVGCGGSFDPYNRLTSLRVLAIRSEPVAPAMFKRINETTAEVDGQIEIGELNRLTGLNLPEDEGYSTLGGYVSTTLGSIPPAGTVFEQAGAKFTVTDADSPISRVEYSRDGGLKWTAVFPVDGIADSKTERYELTLDGVLGDSGITIRASDSMNNADTTHVSR